MVKHDVIYLWMSLFILNIFLIAEGRMFLAMLCIINAYSYIILIGRTY